MHTTLLKMQHAHRPPAVPWVTEHNCATKWDPRCWLESMDGAWYMEVCESSFLHIYMNAIHNQRNTPLSPGVSIYLCVCACCVYLVRRETMLENVVECNSAYNTFRVAPSLLSSIITSQSQVSNHQPREWSQPTNSYRYIPTMYIVHTLTG